MEGWLLFALRAAGLAWAAWMVRLHRTLLGHTDLSAGFWMGWGALGLASGHPSLAVLLWAALLGAGLGPLGLRLDGARFAATGLVLTTAALPVWARWPGLGGHMGLLRPPPSNLSLGAWLGLALGVSLSLSALARYGAFRRWSDRLRVSERSRPLAESLGHPLVVDRMALGSLTATAGAFGGMVGAAGLEHIHPRAYGVEASFDVLAVALLAALALPADAAAATGFPSLMKAGITLGGAALLFVGLEQAWSSSPLLKLCLLALVFWGASIRDPKS